MKKNVIVVSSTPRKGGNSFILASKFAEGALSAGHSVKFINLREMELKFCIGCMSCQKNKTDCVLRDGMKDLYSQIENADVIALASPVYYYSVCGQLKTFLDRLNPLYVRNNKFTDFYLLATAAENDGNAVNGSITAVQGFLDCFEGTTLKGVLRGVGVEDAGDINNTDYPDKAYDMGRRI